MNKTIITCRACRKGTIVKTTKVQKFYPNKKEVQVELIAMVCDHCGVETLLPKAHEENLRRLAARKSAYGNQLMGEEYVDFRKRYGLTQKQATKLIGKSAIAFSRYENEVTYPDESTRLLLTLVMKNQGALKALAAETGVRIPLWAERCEDERGEKLRLLAPEKKYSYEDKSRWTVRDKLQGFTLEGAVA